MAKQRIFSRVPSLVSYGSMSNLVQDITDEFLICKICLENYRNPKCLNCLHTFCEDCIENHIQGEVSYKKYSDYRDFTCPLCRKRTQLPIGGVKKLPDNFLVSSLSDMVCRQRPSGDQIPECDICKRGNEAVIKCLECNKLLCQDCVDLHREIKVTKHHSLIDVETEQEILCKIHPDEVVRFFCVPCEACICVLCTFNDHANHDVSNFGEVVDIYKKDMENLLDRCRERMDEIQDSLDKMDTIRQIIAESEDNVKLMCKTFTKEIEVKEKELLAEIRSIYGPNTFYLLERSDYGLSQLEELRSACKLTEVALTRRDIELLLVKKEVQSKLEQLFQEDMPVLPPVNIVNKVVRYLPGKLEMGYIHDMDLPLTTEKLNCVRRLNMMSSENMPTFETTETQTDSVLCDLSTQTDYDIGATQGGAQCEDRACSPVDLEGAAAEAFTITLDEEEDPGFDFAKSNDNNIRDIKINADMFNYQQQYIPPSSLADDEDDSANSLDSHLPKNLFPGIQRNSESVGRVRTKRRVHRDHHRPSNQKSDTAAVVSGSGSGTNVMFSRISQSVEPQTSVNDQNISQQSFNQPTIDHTVSNNFHNSSNSYSPNRYRGTYVNNDDYH